MSDLKYRIQVPGKTFIFGEYSALAGGSALLAATAPGFELYFNNNHKSVTNPFHEQSPAGVYYKKNSDFFSRWSIDFIDHYQGRGGFGASTAQFLGLAYFKIWNDYSVRGLPPIQTISKMIWDQYTDQNFSSYKKSDSYSKDLFHLPSGYDLWAQTLGSISKIKRNYKNSTIQSNYKSALEFLENDIAFESQHLIWPFKDLQYVIVPTGFKVATHEHLRDLQIESFKKLAIVSDNLMQAFEAGAEDSFVKEMKNWSSELESQTLVHPNSVKLLTRLRENPEIIFSKGCGALGADVILLAYRHKDQSHVKSQLESLGLRVFYNSRNVWNNELGVQKC